MIVIARIQRLTIDFCNYIFSNRRETQNKEL